MMHDCFSSVGCFLVPVPALVSGAGVSKERPRATAWILGVGKVFGYRTAWEDSHGRLGWRVQQHRDQKVQRSLGR